MWVRDFADLCVYGRYEQLTVTAAALREDMHTEIERMLNDVIKFKIHVQQSLEQYEEFVGGEIEREVEEQQQAQEELAAAEVGAEEEEEEYVKVDRWEEDKGEGDGSMEMEE